jgi:hypothetical protein
MQPTTMQNMTRDHNGTVFKENARPVIENVSTVLHIHTLYYHTRKRNSKLCIAIQTRSKLHCDKADVWIVGCVLCLDQSNNGTLWVLLSFH